MYLIDDNPFTLDLVYELILKKTSINLSNGSREKIISCREYLDNKIKSSQSPIYGINTGFGSLCDIKISSNNLKELQENLVRSHACGTGEIVPKNVVKLMILLKILIEKPLNLMRIWMKKFLNQSLKLILNCLQK